jgi:predicted dehydrogenase
VPDEPGPRFKLAIVGAGLITRGTHLPNALSLPEIEVVALVDSVVGRAAELAKEYGVRPLITADASDLIGKVDGAIIATPNHTHRDVAVPLLEAGISTLIEKPLATTVEEGDETIDAARRGNAKIAVAHYQRFLDGPRLLKRLLEERYFGHVTRFCHQFGSSGGWPALSAYTLKREAIGGGVLVVTGTHFLDRMLHMWGMPDEVELRDDSLGGPEAHCEGRVRYTSGYHAPLEGLVRYSKCATLPAGLVLETEHGVVILRDGFDDEVVLVPANRPNIRMKISDVTSSASESPLNPYQRMLRNFVDACRHDVPPEVDGRQGLASMKLLRRFYENRTPIGDDWTAVQASA